MQLEHSFTVPVPPAEAWRVLLDLERVAPCMPGAALESVTGDEFAGKVKVKVGPITVTYRGTGRFVEKDEDGLRVTVEAKAKETRGSGTAAATVQASLLAAGGDETRVDVTTDLAITGKPAQFGRGVMADVGSKLIGQFASCLAEELAAPATSTEPAAAEEPTMAPPSGSPASRQPLAGPDGQGPALESAPAGPGPVAAERRRAADPIDLLQTAGGPVARRVAPALALVGLAAVLFAVRRRRRQS